MFRHPTATCLICNSEWVVNENRVNNHLYCRDCRRSEREIDYGFTEPCKPWSGDFDDDDNPMQNGLPYLPGDRICQHKDCVQKSHILGVTLQKTKRVYRRNHTLHGNPISYQDFLKFLHNKNMSDTVARIKLKS